MPGGAGVTPRTVAALYVEPRRGVYVGVPGVDPGTRRVMRAPTQARTWLWRTRRASGGAGSGTAARANRTSTSWVTTADASRLRCKPLPLWRWPEHPAHSRRARDAFGIMNRQRAQDGSATTTWSVWVCYVE